MKQFSLRGGKPLPRLLKPILFILFGALLGFLYYLKIGCVTGACAITSSPLLSTLYGGILGFLLSNLFTRRKARS